MTADGADYVGINLGDQVILQKSWFLNKKGDPLIKLADRQNIVYFLVVRHKCRVTNLHCFYFLLLTFNFLSTSASCPEQSRSFTVSFLASIFVTLCL